MFKLILAIAMVVAVTWCAPAPKPALSPLLAPYPLVYASPYARVYPYYPAAVPVAYYNGYRWVHPGSLYVY